MSCITLAMQMSCITLGEKKKNQNTPNFLRSSLIIHFILICESLTRVAQAIEEKQNFWLSNPNWF